jgi:hypothetical protein
MGGSSGQSGYVGFVRGTLPKVEPTPPDGLPTSRLFRGIGQAFLNTTLNHADEDVQVVFKSSPMGTRSHGNESNNSFVLWAYGQRLLIRTGHYYLYGGPHHRDWVWSTRSLNNITVNGHGQIKRSAQSMGQILAFHSSPSIDAVIGEAGAAYNSQERGGGERLLDRFTRSIVFVKPELVIVFDRLAARHESSFEYWLHAINEFDVADQRHIKTTVGDVACTIDIMTPQDLKVSQTKEYDPNPWPQITTREWHLTASTPMRNKTAEFVTLIRPYRVGQNVGEKAALQQIDGGYLLNAELTDGKLVALLPTDDSATLKDNDLSTKGEILAVRYAKDGSIVERANVGPLDAAPADHAD